MTIKARQWEDIEHRFRMWAFGVLYNKTYACETDPTIRFAKALIESARPIPDRKSVIDWYRSQKRGRRKHEPRT